MALETPLRKTNTGQKGPKLWSKIGPSIKNVRTLSSFMHAIKTNVLIHLQKLIQVITIFLLSILSFDSLIATAFLLAIIGTFLSRSPYF